MVLKGLTQVFRPHKVLVCNQWNIMVFFSIMTNEDKTITNFFFVKNDERFIQKCFDLVNRKCVIAQNDNASQ